MSPEELSEIRARAESTQRWINKSQPVATSERDRVALLAEVDRLREVGKKLADRANRLDRALDRLSGELRSLADDAYKARV